MRLHVKLLEIILKYKLRHDLQNGSYKCYPSQNFTSSTRLYNYIIIIIIIIIIESPR
jgi:hypothetical protein